MNTDEDSPGAPAMTLEATLPMGHSVFAAVTHTLSQAVG
jgi:hypothetical protein